MGLGLSVIELSHLIFAVSLFWTPIDLDDILDRFKKQVLQALVVIRADMLQLPPGRDRRSHQDTFDFCGIFHGVRCRRR